MTTPNPFQAPSIVVLLDRYGEKAQPLTDLLDLIADSTMPGVADWDRAVGALRHLLVEHDLPSLVRQACTVARHVDRHPMMIEASRLAEQVGWLAAGGHRHPHLASAARSASSLAAIGLGVADIDRHVGSILLGPLVAVGIIEQVPR